MESSQRKEQEAENVFKGGAVILPDGTELPLTEAMIQKALIELMDDHFYPRTPCKPSVSSNQKPD